MRKILFFIILLFSSLSANAATPDKYGKMWENVKEKVSADHPREAISLLQQIVKAANGDKSYGNLLAARIMAAKMQMQIEPDSLQSEVARLEIDARKAEAFDGNLAAVYYAALGRIYRDCSSAFNDSAEKLSEEAFDKALRNPDALYAVSAEEYSPLAQKGSKSYKEAGSSLLALIAHEAHRDDFLLHYYEQKGNRKAACQQLYFCFEGYNESSYELESKGINLADSLRSAIKKYEDLEEAGMLADLLYEEMSDDDDVSKEECYLFLQKALEKWGNGIAGPALRYDVNELTRPCVTVSLTGHDNASPSANAPLLLKVSALNAGDVTVSITRLNADGRTDLRTFSDKDIQKIQKLKAGKPVYSVERSYKDYQVWQQVEDSMVVNPLKPGVYVVESSSKTNPKMTTSSVIYLTGIKLLAYPINDSEVRLIAVSETTGKPVPGAKMRVETEPYGGKKPVVTDLVADKRGMALYKTNNRDMKKVYVYTDDDTAFRENSLRTYFHVGKYVEEKDIATILTDRSIYRPGQAVHATVIVHNAKDDYAIHAVEGRRLRLRGYDANGREFFVDSLTTDAFGVASVSVTIPKDRLNGAFRLSVDGKKMVSAYQYFNVEEYKRPTFEILKPELDKEYLALDSLNADVNGGYRIVNLEMEARTFTQMPLQNAKVRYSIRRDQMWFWWYRNNYGSRAMVTNVETETDANGHFVIPVTLKVPRKSHARFVFNVSVTVTSANGESHTENVALKVRSDNQMPEEPKELKPEEREEFFDVSAETFPSVQEDKASEVTFRMGSCLKDIRAYYIIQSEKGVIDEGSVDFSHEIISRKFRYEPAYGAFLQITYVWVRNGKTHSYQKMFVAPLPEKKMKTHWVTFRDLTRPGSKETWTLHTDVKASSLAATLYDKSLDMIKPFGWSFYPFRNNASISSFLHSTSVAEAYRLVYGSIKTSAKNMSDPFLPSFNDEYFPTYVYGFKGVKVRGASDKLYSLAPMAANSLQADVVMEKDGSALEEVAVVGYGMRKTALAANVETSLEGIASGVTLNNDASAVDLSKMVRSDFSETAFTTSSLLSDKDGNIAMEFTLPESVTTWRFLGFVHDKEMRYGVIDTTCVAQKPIMVQPNMPRFVREGDKATVSVSVTNNDSKPTEAELILQLLDPETEKVICASSKRLSLKANSSESEMFYISTLDKRLDGFDAQLLMVRIAAKTDNGEDGEQHYLPVLPAREMIVNTIPFTIHGNGAFHASAKDLFTPNSTHRRLTLETTENPAWLMVQTLPYIAKPNSNNAISLAATLYANTLASDIIATVPDFEKVLEEWKADSLSLKSNLEKNTELKDILLQQTPWVLEAQNEAQQKQLLAEYFDSEKLNLQLADVTSQLKTLQLSDGSWTWFPGMHGSPYVTSSVTQMLARLSLMSELNAEQREMMLKGIAFLGKELQEDAKELRKLEKKKIKNLHPSEISLVYLYVTSIVDVDKPKGVEKDVDYMIKLMEKIPAEFTIYGKARSAVIFAHHGKAAKAKDYLESMKEYTVSTPEAGRYYSTPRAYYSWFDYRIPTQVAAIEALSILSPSDSTTIDEMKRWLLHEKRTQMWDTPLNTVDAVYAFLMDSSAYTSSTHHSMASSVLADRMDYSKDQLDVNIPAIDIDHATKNTLWGALYVQQMAPLNEITDAASGIKLKREILNPDKDPKVGDMVTVRITITCDRDYDFLVVTDNRPACLEPAEQLSGYRYGYYQEMRDCQSRFFFDRISKGEHFVEAVYYIDRHGDYSSGSCTAQCAYAPEFTGRTAPIIVNVK